MRLYHIISGLLYGLILKPSNTKELYDFTTKSNLNDWVESSDTVRDAGMSKAVMVLQKTHLVTYGVFFSLLNPQPNGAGFAGVQLPVAWNLSAYDSLGIKCRAQGQNKIYKVVLRHHGDPNDGTSYEQFFNVDISNSDFTDVKIPMSDFKAYYRGQEVKNAPPLDRASVTKFGLQIAGGVYQDFKQSGVSSLEIQQVVGSEK